MNAHIQHLHHHAQLAELQGFKHFAAAIRKLLAKAILDLTNKEATHLALSMPFDENPYLAGLPVCACCPDPVDKITAPYTMFGKHSSNRKFSLREIPPRQ